MNRFAALLLKLLDSLMEEREPKPFFQPEDPILAEKRFKAEHWLDTESPHWRDRRNQNAPKDSHRAHESAAE